jgi:hypothetical protein
MPSARLRRRAVRLFRRAPKTAQLLIVLTLAILLWLTLNWMYQVVRKPSELFFPVSGTPIRRRRNWRQYVPMSAKRIPTA